MVGSWQTVPLAELIKPDKGISYGIVQPGAHEADGVPIVRVTDVRNGRIAVHSPLRVAPAIEKAYARTRLAGGELLLTIVGTVGECAVVPKSLAGWNTARAIAVLPIAQEVGAYWVQLALRAQVAQDIIKSRLNTTVQATLNLRDVAQLPIVLPPTDERRAIAHILGTLDDKIELNRRMNETLDEMARTLFKSWFVDFDPVRRKAAGRDPGLPKHLADLFPSRFVDSELGEIPEGWRASTLGSEVVRCGGSIQTGPFGSQLHASDYLPAGVPVVMPKDLIARRVSTGSIARVDESDALRLTRHQLQVGDVIYSRRGDVEKHALIGPREVGWLCGTGCLLVRLGPRWPSPAFASFALDRPETRSWLVQHAIGATMPNLNTGILAAVPLVMAEDPLLHAFARLVHPMQEQTVALDTQCSSLMETRDTLLPKLISGELRVKDAERILEAAP